MKKNLLFVMLLLPLMALAQSHYTAKNISKLSGAPKEGYQGMDIWKNYLVSCQNTGIVTLYNFNGDTIVKIGNPFHLASYSKFNHSNVASFGTTFYTPSDKLPLIYISQTYKKPINGKKDLLYVERINPDSLTAQLVQTICFNDTNHLFGYALQWVVDRENNCLYGYGNTIDNNNQNNKHRIIKVKMPTLADSKDGFVTLNESDLLENYLIEDTYKKPFNPIGQGLFVRNGLLFMPTGFGTQTHPSIFYVWDLKSKKMREIDLIQTTQGELEDCAFSNGNLYLQGQKGIFKLTFARKDAKKLRLNK